MKTILILLAGVVMAMGQVIVPPGHSETSEVKPAQLYDTTSIAGSGNVANLDRGTIIAAIQISNPKTGEVVLKIFTDGKIEVGHNVKPDEAARQFLQALREMAPEMLKGDCATASKAEAKPAAK